MLKAWMQKDSDKPLGAEKHLTAGTVAGKTVNCIQCTVCTNYLLHMGYWTNRRGREGDNSPPSSASLVPI